MKSPVRLMLAVSLCTAISPVSLVSAAVTPLYPTVTPEQASPAYAWSGSQVQRAYARRHAILDAAGRQYSSAARSADLFPAYGFQPPSRLGSWSVRALDEDRSEVCVTTPVNSMALWTAALVQLSGNRMLPADAQCGSLTAFAVPSSFPSTISAHKVLDRRDSPVPTILPTYPVLSGFTPRAVLPSLTMYAHPSQVSNTVTFYVYNTPTIISTDPVVEFMQTGVSAVTVRPGFSVEHNCAIIYGGDSCAIRVQYTGETAMSQKAASLRLEFSTGQFAVISLAGKTLSR